MEHEFERLSAHLCNDNSYLTCMEIGKNRCTEDMRDIASSCLNVPMIVSSSEPIEPQVQRTIIECILARHVEIHELKKVAVNTCYLERKSTR